MTKANLLYCGNCSYEVYTSTPKDKLWEIIPVRYGMAGWDCPQCKCKSTVKIEELYDG